MTLRAGLLAGTAAAALAAVPAAFRAASGGVSLPSAWLLLAGGTALVLGPVVALGRAAPKSSAGFLAPIAAIAAAAAPLSLFASLLYRKTHHRPLGAATFAMVALALLVAFGFVAWRALAPLHRSASLARVRWVRSSILAVSGFVTLGLFAGATAAAGFRASLFDAGVALALSVACLVLRLPETRLARAAKVALPVWALLVVAGIALSLGPVGDAVGQVAPVLSPLNGW